METPETTEELWLSSEQATERINKFADALEVLATEIQYLYDSHQTLCTKLKEQMAEVEKLKSKEA